MATQSVTVGLRVLEEVSVRQPAGLSSLARELGIPKATVQRCLVTLADEGWIRRTTDGSGWILTAKAFVVGSRVEAAGALREAALPVLSELQQYTRENIHLMVAEGRDMVLIERLDSSYSLRVFRPIGGRGPMHVLGNGIVYLAHQPAAAVERYLSQELVAATGRSIVDPDELRARLAEVRSAGYCVNEEGYEEGIVSVSAPIIGMDGNAVATFSISGPTSRVKPDRYEDYGQRAVAAATQVGRTLRSAP